MLATLSPDNHMLQLTHKGSDGVDGLKSALNQSTPQVGYMRIEYKTVLLFYFTNDPNDESTLRAKQAEIRDLFAVRPRSPAWLVLTQGHAVAAQPRAGGSSAARHS